MWVAGLHRSAVRYAAARAEDGPLRRRLRELATEHLRWGSPRLIWRLRREGWLENHKRIRRLYRLEGLAVRRQRRKRVAVPRVRLPTPIQPNERWSMDFVRDTLRAGRAFRALTIADGCTRECPAIEVDVGLSGARAAAAFERLALSLAISLRDVLRPRVSESRAGCLGSRAQCAAATHSAGQASGERFRRKL